MSDKKGIVVKTEGKKAYILTKDGEFTSVRISGKAPIPGSEYEGRTSEIKMFFLSGTKKIAAAAVFLLIFIAGGGALAYNIPVTTKTLSDNPKVEVKTNVFNNVISVSSTDPEIEKQLENINLKNSDLEQDIKKIVENKKATESIKKSDAPKYTPQKNGHRNVSNGDSKNNGKEKNKQHE